MGVILARAFPVVVLGVVLGACGSATTHPAGPNGASSSSSAPSAGRAELHAKALALGAEHACALANDGKVLCWGANKDGQLGDGTTTRRDAPVAVTGLPAPAVEIAAGASHTCARVADGGVWCWGSNGRGQLGDGTLDTRTRPVRVENLLAAASIAAGGHRTCARNAADHFVVCWGELTEGGATKNPEPVFDMPATEEIAVGALHACARVADGHVRCWGDNAMRQLGVQHQDDRGLPVDVHDLEKVVQLSMGERHSCARTADGVALCWGGGLVCVPGDWFEGKRVAVRPGTILGMDGATSIAAGADKACVVKKDGTVACARPRGTTGDPKERACVSDIVPGLAGVADVAIGGAFACARLAKDGAVLCWSDGVAPAPIPL